MMQRSHPKNPKRVPRIPGKRVVWIGGRPVVMSDADYRAFLGGIEKPPKKNIDKNQK